MEWIAKRNEVPKKLNFFKTLKKQWNGPNVDAVPAYIQINVFNLALCNGYFSINFILT